MIVAIKVTAAMLIIAIIAFLFSGLSLRHSGDDLNFSRLLLNSNVYDVIYDRYIKWSGRLTIDALMVYTIRYEYFWKTFIPACVILISFIISKITLREKQGAMIPFTVSLFMFFLIEPEVNADASWWIAGSYNYLMPATLCLLSVYAVLNEKSLNIILKSLSVLPAMYFGFNEQISICFLIFLACRAIYLKRITPIIAAMFVTTIACAIILFSAPGNKLRYFSESKNWLPDYVSYGIFQKLSIGVDVLSSHVSSSGNVLINIAMLTLLLLYVKRKDFKVLPSISAAIVAVKLIMFLSFLLGANIFKGMVNSNYLSGSNWAGTTVYISHAVTLLTISSMICLAVFNARCKNDAFYSCFTILLACASVMMIMFSPSAYGSGKRVLFVFQVLMLIYTMQLINQFLSEKRPHQRPDFS
ncbi:hypothetical protein AUQ18_09005 [Escherichia coli]|nr:hypothetical protein AUQ18_09005 [Escherichia coli]KXR85728.1 hypothetical protein AUQ29_06685 [Escherichia coli]